MKKLADCGITNNDMLMLTKRSGVIQSPGLGKSKPNLNSQDQNLLDGFFKQVKDDIDRQPKVNFNQMFNQLFHN